VHISATSVNAESSGGDRSLEEDPDDSWYVAEAANALSLSAGVDLPCALPGNRQAVWVAHPPLHARQDAHLEFVFRDADGKPLPLEPYMGMMSHAAVLRGDGAVFAHLHPTGNYSMAAQSYFAAKIAREASGIGEAGAVAEMDHSKMHHGAPGEPPVSSLSIPYEFPSPGDYSIWVQVKSGRQVFTGTFRTNVAP
jgi:hypothetical protein